MHHALVLCAAQVDAELVGSHGGSEACSIMQAAASEVAAAETERSKWQNAVDEVSFLHTYSSSFSLA